MASEEPELVRRQGVDRVADGMSRVAAGLIALLLLVGNANLLARWMTGQQIPGADELIVLLLPMSVFLAAPLAERDGVNVRSTALLTRLPERPRRVATAIGLLISLVTAAALTVATSARALESWQRGELRVGVRSLPVWPSKAAIAVGLAGLVVVFAVELWRLREETPVLRGDPSL